MKDGFDKHPRAVNDNDDTISLAAERAARRVDGETPLVPHADNDDYALAANDNPSWDRPLRELIEKYESYKKDMSEGKMQTSTELTVRTLELGGNLVAVRQLLPAHPTAPVHRKVLDMLNLMESELHALRPGER